MGPSCFATEVVIGVSLSGGGALAPGTAGDLVGGSLTSGSANAAAALSKKPGITAEMAPNARRYGGGGQDRVIKWLPRFKKENSSDALHPTETLQLPFNGRTISTADFAVKGKY